MSVAEAPPVYASPPPEYQPRPATETAFDSGLWAGRIESVTIAAVAYYLYEQARPRLEDESDAVYERELEETHALMEELKAEHAKTDPLVSAIQQPQSGQYVGHSAEDDDGDQGVLTHLNFSRDGTVSGWGKDGVDGYYVIKGGVWSTTGGDDAVQRGGRVAWIEKYEKGFEVALRGQIRADGTIRAMWASTMGVTGSVDLMLV